MSKIIALEGIDGSGKTTQAKKIADFLQEKGIPCISTGEPRHTLFGAKLVEASYGLDVSTTTSRLLYEAIRRDHLDTVIMPSLADGKIVVCDRFFLSTMAYNNNFVKRGEGYIDILLDELMKYNLESLESDCVINILIDVTLDGAIDRIKSRNDRHDDFWSIENPIEKLSNVRMVYKKIFSKSCVESLPHVYMKPNFARNYVVNGNGGEEQVFDQILCILKDEINLDTTT